MKADLESPAGGGREVCKREEAQFEASAPGLKSINHAWSFSYYFRKDRESLRLMLSTAKPPSKYNHRRVNARSPSKP